MPRVPAVRFPPGGEALQRSREDACCVELDMSILERVGGCSFGGRSYRYRNGLYKIEGIF